VGNEKWEIENGTIHGLAITKDYGYLRTEKNYKDFHMSLRFKCEGDGNSGVFFHVDFKPGTVDVTRDAIISSPRAHCRSRVNMKFPLLAVVKTVPIAILVFTALARPMPAQDSPSIKVDVNVVNILCTVYDQRGALVTDLKKEDFTIFENGRPQPIRYFARETDLPLTLAMMVDVSGSVARFVELEKDTAARFLETVLRPGDQALLMGFSSTIILWQDLTPSPARLKAALQQLRAIRYKGLPAEGQPMPLTLLYDAVQAASNEKVKNVAGRKAMVIISDGLDNGSIVKQEAAIAAVEATNTVVYSICIEANQSGSFGCSNLKNLSEATGGRMFQVGKKLSLQEIFKIIEDEMRSQYALGFAPSNPERDGKFHRLEVRVAQKGLKVRTRKGYYATTKRVW
jgi:VWFA-related protein